MRSVLILFLLLVGCAPVQAPLTEAQKAARLSNNYLCDRIEGGNSSEEERLEFAKRDIECNKGRAKSKLALGKKPKVSKKEIELATQLNFEILLKDADSVKDLRIGELEVISCMVKSGMMGERWAVPVTFNAKNSYGGYTGLSTKYLYFKDGKPTTFVMGEHKMCI